MKREQSVFLLEKLSCITGVDIILQEDGRRICLGEEGKGNPLTENEAFCREMCIKADSQEHPVIFRDEYQVIFAAVKNGGSYCLAGPMNLSVKNRVEWHRYYRNYGIKKEEHPLPVMNITRILQLVEAIANILLEISFTDSELIAGNKLNTLDPAKERMCCEPAMPEMEELLHHSYQEELALLECVKKGKAEEAMRRSCVIDSKVGKMSEDNVTHWKDTMIVGITLCSRAAIEGGVPPTEAYRISDYYIRKGNESRDVNIIMSYRNMAIMDLTECVLKSTGRPKMSAKVEQCRKYINKNYSKKISLKDMAEETGVSCAYLSRMFSKEMGMTIQQYITYIRLQQAEKLLRDTDFSITEIAECVNFTTQSRFTEQFRIWKKITPGEYRRKYACMKI